MTELRLRLIRDGKIVGYEWHRISAPDARAISVWYRHEGEESWLYNGDMEIDYDSFDLGSKVGNDWWYEGDILEENTGNRYELKYADGCLFVQYTDTSRWSPLVERDKWKSVGNIHEVTP